MVEAPDSPPAGASAGVQVHIAYRDGAYRCYRTETGTDRTDIGCSHRVPRSAIEHTARLAARSGLDATSQTAAGEDRRALTEPPVGHHGGSRSLPVATTPSAAGSPSLWDER